MFLRILKRLGLAALAAIAVAIIAGVIYQWRGEHEDAQKYPAPGKLVSIGASRLHLNCSGEGSPTVILEAVSGGFSTQWAWVQPELARLTRVCSYDRAGRAWSDPGPAGDLWQTEENLHTLLTNAGIEGPYILVGHSIGGLYVRAFAARHPEEVVGLGLVDSSHPEQYDQYPELGQSSVLARMMWTFPWMARVGLFRHYFHQGGEIDFQDLPPRQHAEMAAIWSSPRLFESVIDEVNVAPTIFAQAHELGSLGDLPLAVVSADKQPDSWKSLQNQLAALSSRSTHITVEGAAHSSLALNPEHARQTTRALAELVALVRSSSEESPANAGP